MNFEKLPPVTSSELMIDRAFRKAREKGIQKDLGGNWLQKIRQKEMLKLDVIKDILCSDLQAIRLSFPVLKSLPQFYTKIVDLTLDRSLFEQALRSIGRGEKTISVLHRATVRRIVRETERVRISAHVSEFYGRISSVMREVKKPLQYLEECRRVMRTYPDIKELPTVCLYGFPNVGKTTILNQLTGTKAKVAAYAFTTKSINTGYIINNSNTIQVLDVPGTLARPEKMNRIERQAELALQELADVIVYVFDPSPTGGYDWKEQEKLLHKIQERKNVLIYVSKVDLLTEKEKKELPFQIYTLDQLKEKIIELIAGK
ncbi:TPA: GTP-binding protein [Candidatus Woesearchaeota archaeon]|nr:GTP-binding protein [Candidatus Woesearchaeota archaeon]